MNIIKIIHLINKEAINIASKPINNKIITNSLLFSIASILGLKRTKINNTYTNYVGITFAISGAGKNLSLDIIERNLNVLDNYISIIKNSNEIILTENLIEPSEWKIPLLGTIQGVMRVGNWLNEFNIGSLNIVEDEFGSVLDRQIMTFIIKMWQSGSSSGSINVNQAYNPIKNVPLNALLFGTLTPFERDLKKYEHLIEVLQTGFARRAFFVNVEPEKMFIINEKYKTNLQEELNKIVSFISKLPINYKFNIEPEAQKFIDNFRQEVINEYNKEPNEWNAIKVNSIDKLIRASAIVSAINLRDYVSKEDIEFTISFMNQSNNYLEELIKPKQPYLKMYKVLKIKKTMFRTELMDAISMKLKKQELEEQISMLKEYAYRKNMELHTDGLVLHLLPLKDTNLNEIIVSVNNEKKGAKGIESKAYNIKFFGDGNSVENLVKSNVDWFSFIHYNGTRKQQNVIPEFNCIAFDIDDGLSLDDALDKLIPYTYIIYTTRNHQKEKNGYVADRFRIILPLSKKLNLNGNRYKKFNINVAKLLGIYNFIDTSTIEIARLWFPNSETQIFKNLKESLEPTCCIPNTENETKVLKQIENINTSNLNKREEGIVRWALANAVVGSRNNTLFKVAMLYNDITGNKEKAKDLVLRVNNMLIEPLSEKEIKATIFKSLNRR